MSNNISNKKFLEVFKKYNSLGWNSAYMERKTGLSPKQIIKLRSVKMPNIFGETRSNAFKVMKNTLAIQPENANTMVNELLPYFNNQTHLAYTAKVNTQTINRIANNVGNATFGKDTDHQAVLDLWMTHVYPTKQYEKLKESPAVDIKSDESNMVDLLAKKEEERIAILTGTTQKSEAIGVTLQQLEDLEPLKPHFKSKEEEAEDAVNNEIIKEMIQPRTSPQVMDPDEKTKIFTNLGLWFYKTMVLTEINK